MNPQIQLVMRIIILFLIGRWRPFNVSLGTKNSILNSIGESHRFRLPLVHEG